MPTYYWLKFGNSTVGFNGSGVQFAKTTGTIVLSISFTGKNYSTSKSFGVKVTFGSPIIFTVDGTPIQSATSTYTANLKYGESVALGEIPEGTTYSVTEVALSNADKALCYNNGSVTNASGTMVAEAVIRPVANFLYGVTIGGRFYAVAPMPDGKIWLAENLDYKASGITIGGTDYSVPQACYYNNDEATYGANGRKCGLMYSRLGVKHLVDNKNSLTPGWHVPTYTEWDTLVTALGTNAGAKLKASSVSWASGWGGTDNYGFGALPGGYRRTNFYNAGTKVYFGNDPSVGSTTTTWRYLKVLSNNSSDVGQENLVTSTSVYLRSNAYIRLVKD